MSYESQISAAIERLVIEALTSVRTVQQAQDVVETACLVCERTTERVLTMAPPSTPIACRAGCAWCCTERILVTPPEALRIAAWLTAHRSPDEMTALRQQLADVAAATHDLSWQQHARLTLPCPLLCDSACSVHAVRPLVCRSHNSLDAKRCESHSRTPTKRGLIAYKPQQDLANGTAKGISAGLETLGLQGEFVELVSALRTALERTDAAERWQNGERVF